MWRGREAPGLGASIQGRQGGRGRGGLQLERRFGMTPWERPKVLGMLRTVLFSLWLPVLVLAISLVRFGPRVLGPGPVPDLEQLLVLFALAWPSAIPLTLALRLLHRRSKLLAYACAVFFGLVSYFAVLLGGLMGYPGVVGYTVAVSLPVWALLGVLAVADKRKGGQGLGSRTA